MTYLVIETRHQNVAHLTKEIWTIDILCKIERKNIYFRTENTVRLIVSKILQVTLLIFRIHQKEDSAEAYVKYYNELLIRKMR